MPAELTRTLSIRKRGEIDANKEWAELDSRLSKCRNKLVSNKFVFPKKFSPSRFENDDGEIMHVAELVFTRSVERVREATEQRTTELFEEVIAAINGGSWTIFKINGEDACFDEILSEEEFLASLKLEEIELDRTEYFQGIYELDNQIDVALSAIKVSLETRLRERPHILLMGLPASGKTSTSEEIQKMIGSSRCLRLDGTTISKAGLEETLLERMTGNEIMLVIEEIEKASDGNNLLTPLLQLMDDRATISKNNARGSRSVKRPLLVLATVNDVDKLKKMMSGALYSRFATKIYFGSPSADVLKRILEERIKLYNGRMEWITPCLTYFLEQEQIYDPRVIIPACLAGKDGWLDGSYQRKLKAVRELTDEEEKIRLRKMLNDFNRVQTR